jgi:hypothetical protein
MSVIMPRVSSTLIQSPLRPATENDDETGNEVSRHALKAQADAHTDGAKYEQEAEIHPTVSRGSTDPPRRRSAG